MNFTTRNIEEKAAVERTRTASDKNSLQHFPNLKLTTGFDSCVPETLFKESKLKRGIRILRRLSPFLILGFFLMGLFPYMFLTGNGTIHNVWFLLFLFVFLEVNVLYADFALWKYFGSKKVFKIWMIEIPLTFLVIHFLI